MQITEETYKIQSGLAEYCRTGVLPDLPGLTPNRVQQYRRLVYNIIDDTFEGAFPITRNFLSDEEWHGLVNAFFSDHACSEPSIWKLPFELYEFLAVNGSELKDKYPFLTDLIYFEWLEIDVHTMPDEPQQKFKAEGNWLKEKIVINKEFKLAQFRYPVHQFKPSQLMENSREGAYFVLIYREPVSGNVQFFGLSPLFAFIITQLAEEKNDLDFIIYQTCALFRIRRSSEVETTIINFLVQLKQKEFVFGFTE
jgi:hypothetical protein